MNANSFFILHDEDPLLNTKQVMFGHINCVNEITTDEEFYHKLPDMLRKNKGKVPMIKEENEDAEE